MLLGRKCLASAESVRSPPLCYLRFRAAHGGTGWNRAAALAEWFGLVRVGVSGLSWTLHKLPSVSREKLKFFFKMCVQHPNRGMVIFAPPSRGRPREKRMLIRPEPRARWRVAPERGVISWSASRLLTSANSCSVRRWLCSKLKLRILASYGVRSSLSSMSAKCRIASLSCSVSYAMQVRGACHCRRKGDTNHRLHQRRRSSTLWRSLDIVRRNQRLEPAPLHHRLHLGEEAHHRACFFIAWRTAGKAGCLDIGANLVASLKSTPRRSQGWAFRGLPSRSSKPVLWAQMWVQSAPRKKLIVKTNIYANIMAEGTGPTSNVLHHITH